MNTRLFSVQYLTGKNCTKKADINQKPDPGSSFGMVKCPVELWGVLGSGLFGLALARFLYRGAIGVPTGLVYNGMVVQWYA